MSDQIKFYKSTRVECFINGVKTPLNWLAVRLQINERVLSRQIKAGRYELIEKYAEPKGFEVQLIGTLLYLTTNDEYND